MMGEMGDDGSVLPGHDEGGEGSLTEFSSCLKLPHHDPSPPSFLDLRTPALNPARCLVSARWLHLFRSGPSRRGRQLGIRAT
jgi:hypothetical protein